MHRRRSSAARISNEDPVVPPDALHAPARGLRAATRIGVGRHRPRAVRRALRARALQRVHGRARARRRARLRRHLRERAPPERLRPDAVAEPDRGGLARRTADAALVVMGNSLALYNPPVRVAEEMAMLDCISGGRLVAGFPVGTPMDTCYAYGQNPSQLRERYYEAHDLIMTRVAGAEAVHLERPLPQAPLRERLAAPGPAAAPAGLDPRRRLDRDLALVRRARLRLLLPLVLRLQAGPRDDEGLLGGARAPGRRAQPVSRGFLQFVGVAESRAEALELYREPAEYFYGRCLHVDPRFATAPGYTSEASLRARVQSQVARAAAQSRASERARRRPALRGDRRAGLRDHRQPRRGRRAAARGRDRAQRRPPDAAAAVRQHEPRAHAAQLGAVREARDAAARGPLRRRVGEPLVAAPASRRRSARGRASCAH